MQPIYNNAVFEYSCYKIKIVRILIKNTKVNEFFFIVVIPVKQTLQEFSDAHSSYDLPMASLVVLPGGVIDRLRTMP